jgi:hypothetical protein
MQGEEQDRDVGTGFGDFSGCFYAILCGIEKSINMMSGASW